MTAVQKSAPASGPDYKTMQVRPLAGALGALITGVDLRDRANKPMWAELHRAFLEFQVIAVRGQDLVARRSIRGRPLLSAIRASIRSPKAWKVSPK